MTAETTSSLPYTPCAGGRVMRMNKVNGRGGCPTCSAQVEVQRDGFTVSHPGRVTRAHAVLPTPTPAPVTTPRRSAGERCMICGGPADMRSSIGPACQAHYDLAEFED